jgi:hypothetical protein
MTASAHSEAACLLETGRLYTSRVGLATRDGDALTFAGFKKGAFSLYFDDAPIYHFDLEGRWQRVFLEGTHFLKGLDTTVHRIDRVREGVNLVLRRKILSFAETADLDARVRATALDLIESIIGSRLDRREPPAGIPPLTTEALVDFLERIAAWDADAWFAHRERYLSTYGPLPFVPPDCQNAVILQATLGHAGGIGFGGSPVAEHYVRSAAEFEAHCRDVAKLLGRRLAQCRTVFLAGADVLRQPPDVVARYLDAIGEVFPLSKSATEPASASLDGVYTFLDDFGGLKIGPESWREFHERGLGRVSLGVESGAAAIREDFGKRWDEDNLRAAVAAIKSAGIGVSVLTLVGAGGNERAGDHESETARLITSLGLGSGDIVFLLDANEVRDPDSEEGIPSLKGEAWSAQQARMKDALKPEAKGLWKVLPYSLEKQWA